MSEHPLSTLAGESTLANESTLASVPADLTTASAPEDSLELLFEVEPEVEFLYTTDGMTSMEQLQSWTQFRLLLGQVNARAEANPEGFQYLQLTRDGDDSTWAQMTPLGPDEHLVEVSDDAGWVDEIRPLGRSTGWTTDQTEALMRQWVTRKFQRDDAVRVPVPR